MLVFQLRAKVKIVLDSATPASGAHLCKGAGGRITRCTVGHPTGATTSSNEQDLLLEDVFEEDSSKFVNCNQ